MTPPVTNQSAAVIFSGGQDSSTCLAWALSRFSRVWTIGFAYGQRHAVELECRSRIREALAELSPVWAKRLAPDAVLSLDVFRAMAATALTSDAKIEEHDDGRPPSTFVPGRNLLFGLCAAIWAYGRGIRHLVLGVGESDYSGYPDCRDDSVKALQLALNTGMDARFILHTPLMWRTKAETWQLAQELGGAPLVRLIVEESHTCYLGDRGTRHAWGYGCGQCPACRLRAAGYAAWQKNTAQPLPGKDRP